MNDLLNATKKAVDQAASSDIMQSTAALTNSAWESSAAAVGASLNAIPGQGRLMDLTYVADRLIAMGFPGRFPHNPIDGMAQRLHGSHPGRFMIWNISEESYDYGKFDGQVMQHQCPGYPAPPLGMLFSICRSMENWLNADSENIAVVHCWTGKGRTNTVLACFLAWVGAFCSPQHALQHLCEVRDMKMDQAVIASQNRTLVCFQRMMQGVQPKMDSLRLLRVICTSVPVFERQRVRNKDAKPSAGAAQAEEDAQSRIIGGCRPCLQMWRIGEKQLTYNSVRDGGGRCIEAPKDAKMFMPSFTSEDNGSFSFTVDKKFQGDIMLRLLHLAPQPAQAKGAAAPKAKKQVAIMARGTFHTGYIHDVSYILRLGRAQLDVDHPKRFEDDFFMDLIFDAPSEKKDDEDDGDDGGLGLGGDEEASASVIKQIDASEKSLYDEGFWLKMKEHISQLPLEEDAKKWVGLGDEWEARRRHERRQYESSLQFQAGQLSAQMGAEKLVDAGWWQSVANSTVEASKQGMNMTMAAAAPAGGSMYATSMSWMGLGAGATPSAGAGAGAAAGGRGGAAEKAKAAAAKARTKHQAIAAAKAKAAAATPPPAPKPKSPTHSISTPSAPVLSPQETAQIDELAALEKELGLESLSDTLRNLDAQIAEGSTPTASGAADPDIDLNFDLDDDFNFDLDADLDALGSGDVDPDSSLGQIDDLESLETYLENMTSDAQIYGEDGPSAASPKAADVDTTDLDLGGLDDDLDLDDGDMPEI
jgi:hypothetical protein